MLCFVLFQTFVWLFVLFGLIATTQSVFIKQTSAGAGNTPDQTIGRTESLKVD